MYNQTLFLQVFEIFTQKFSRWQNKQNSEKSHFRARTLVIIKSIKEPSSDLKCFSKTFPTFFDRTSEQAPPPPEMPSWQQRQGQAHSAAQYQGGGGGGGRGGHRGRGHDQVPVVPNFHRFSTKKIGI